MYWTVRIKKGTAVVFLAAVALFLAFWNWRGELYAGAQIAQAEKATGIPLPAVMYHGLLKDPDLQGKYVISPDVFEKDLQYLKGNGYTAVFIEDLIQYVQGEADLPEKPVLLTFDDGYYNNYYYAYPLAKQYEMKIIISPVGIHTDKCSETEDLHVTYSNITWENIREMASSGYVEFQNHTYNLHSNGNGERLGTKKLASETQAQYESILRTDLNKMQEKMQECLGKAPACFTYPFGAISSGEPELIREMGFQSTLTCESRLNYITRDPECLYDLGRFLRTSEMSSEEFFSSCFS